MAAACIATANMLFLVLAGVWLSGFADRLPASPAAAPADIAPRLARIEQSITTLEQQLADLQVAANAQQQLIVSAYQSIGDQLQARPDQAPATATQTTPGGTRARGNPGDGGHPAAARSWYVDLGSFPSNKAAVEVQKSLQALGFDAQIKAGSGGGTPTHELILANFEDRASAEVIATQLMEQTELESVSVWKRNNAPGKVHSSSVIIANGPTRAHCKLCPTGIRRRLQKHLFSEVQVWIWQHY